MHFDFQLINGLMFGIAHSGELFIEFDDDPETVHTASGIIIMLGIFQLAILFEN